MTTAKRIIEGTQLGTGAATLYTSPTNTKCLIKKLTFSNTSASAVKVTIYLVPSGGAAGDPSTLRKQKTVGPLDVWEAFEAENHLLEAGDFIQALADAGASITAMGTGIEMT